MLKISTLVMTTSRSNKTRIGQRIGQLAARLSRSIPDAEDQTLYAACQVALAWRSVVALEAMGVNLEFKGQPLVLPHLERAYREIMRIRSKLPEDLLDTTQVDKYGRFDATDIPEDIISFFDRDIT